MKDTTELCLEYSKQLTEDRRIKVAQDATRAALDDACSDLQALWRRSLTRALRGTGAIVRRARVWSNIDHSKRPVTVMPVASASILLRKGMEVSVSIVATEDAIRAQAALIGQITRLKSAIGNRQS